MPDPREQWFYLLGHGGNEADGGVVHNSSSVIKAAGNLAEFPSCRNCKEIGAFNLDK